MAKRGVFSFPKVNHALMTMGALLKQSGKHPAIGVTQGGSSRIGRGAKVAATPGTKRAETTS